MAAYNSAFWSAPGWNRETVALKGSDGKTYVGDGHKVIDVAAALGCFLIDPD